MQQQPPNELVFSNQTGALVYCGIGIELAKSIELADSQLATKSPNQQPEAVGSDMQQLPGRSEQSQTIKQQQSIERLLRLYDIQIKWEKEDGEEVEPSLSSAHLLSNQKKPLRYVRQFDGALVFEPFRANEFKAEIHATSYRCSASSLTRGASLISRDMRVKAYVVLSMTNSAAMKPTTTTSIINLSDQLIQINVLDEMVLAGNSALFKCSIPNSMQDYLQVLDWFEYPTEYQLSVQSTTINNLNQLFPPMFKSKYVQYNNNNQSSSHNNNKPASQQQQELLLSFANNNSILHRYFVSPKSGDLHILNVDMSLNSRSYKCRCKNKFTGEIVESLNAGKLMVTGE